MHTTYASNFFGFILLFLLWWFPTKNFLNLKHIYILSAFALYFPLNSKEISNFTIEYENGEKFETDFAIAEILSIPSKNSHNFLIIKIMKLNLWNI